MAKPRRKHPNTKVLAELPDGTRFIEAMHRALGKDVSYEPLGYMRPDRVHVFDFDGSLGHGILFEIDRVEDGEPLREWHFAQRRIGLDVRGTWIIDLISDGDDSAYYEHFEPTEDDDLAPTLWADFCCDECRAPAAMVAHVPPGESLPALGADKQPDMIDLQRVVVWFGDELFFCYSRDDESAQEAARTAIADRDATALYLAEDEFAPFFCPGCAKVYCPAHWTEFEGARICPSEHARRVTH